MSQGDDWGSFWAGEPGLESPSTPNSGYVEDWPSFYDSDPLLEQPPLSPSAFGLLLLDAADDAAARGLIGAEPNLGLPAASEYVLTSTTGGVRSWVPLSPLLGLDWGNIGGTLSSQTDLQAALNGKQNHSANLDSWSALATSTKQDALTFSQSVHNVSGTVTLTNDSGSPGNSQYYGTNTVGTRGFYDLPSSAIWGSITGTLSNQTDLQNALNGKEPTIAAGTTAQYWRGDKTWQTLNAEVPLTFSQSISRASNTVTLSGDSATPGNSKYYGTNASGARGYYALPTGFSGNFTDLNFTGSNLNEIATRNFTDLQSKPTTIGGYGITDFNSLGDARWQPLGNYESPLTFTAPLARSANTVSIPAATSSQNGYLSSSDWTTFSTKSDPALYNQTARVDPSGHDTGPKAGLIGRPDDRPFLTVQGAINAAQAMTPPGPQSLVIITGNNSFTEDLTTGLPRVCFVGSETDDYSTSQAFNSLTASGTAIIVLNNVNGFNITTTALSGILKVEMNNAYCLNVSSTGTNGTVEIFSDFATGWVYGDITADKTIRVYGVEVDGVVSSISSGDIHLSALQGPEGDPTACFPEINSPGSAVTVDGVSLVRQVTDCASLTLKDSRVYGTNNATTTTYADVLLVPRGSTASLTNSTDKNFLTDAGLTVLGNTSGTNTGDQYGGVTASGASQYLRRNAGNTAYEFGALPAFGDFSSNTSTSVDSEVVLFSGTGGKTGKRATGSGLATLASGVLGTTTNNTSNWDTAYTDRLKWDGGAAGLTASIGRTSLGLVIGTDVQAWDGDLDALAALSGTHTMYYRSAANTWSAVTIGAGLDFTSATLSATGGGGTTPGGSNTQVQYNNSSAFGGIANATTDGTTLTLTSPKIVTGIKDTNGNSLVAYTATTNAIFGLTLANAASGGSVALGVTAPTQAASGIVGTPLTVNASNAVAGSSTAGAVAGGSVTITAGNAARLTSGNANGGDVNLVSGSGIGTGTTGKIVVGDGSKASLTLASNLSGSNDSLMTFGNAIIDFDPANVGVNQRFTNAAVILGGSITLGWGSAAADNTSNDTGLRRSGAAATAEVNNGTSGQWGSLKLGVRDAGTTTVTNGLTIGHQSTGTPAAGLGSALLFNIDSSTTADQNAGRVYSAWTTATHASRTSKVVLQTVNSAAALSDSLIVNAGASATIGASASAGLGVPNIVAVSRVTAQSAANSSISTFTVGSADGSFEVSMNMNVTAATALSTSLNCNYTDESNTARTMIFPTTSLNGTFLTGGLVTSTGAFETPVMHIRCKASTTVTLYTATGTFTSVTYTAEGIIKEIV